jgi:ABC-type nitrate/sulfonate/bicarbonate transport system permease component
MTTAEPVARRSSGRRGRIDAGRLAVHAGSVVTTVVGIAIALLLWELASLRLGEYVMPGPLDTARHIADNLVASSYLERRGFSDGGGYVPHLWYTTRNVLVGVGIGAAVGVIVGLTSLLFPVVAEIAGSITAVFGTAPIFVAAPFFLIWFGIVPTAQVMIVAFYTSLLMFVFSRRAGDNLSTGYIESARTLGATHGNVFRRIYLPGSIPEMAGGLRIALAGAWGLAGIAELLGAQQGAGFLIKFYATAFRVDGMLALIILLGLIAVGFDRVLVAMTRYLIRWREAGQAGQL